MTTKQRLLRRLMPLYVALLLQGFVLWYAIERLYMTQIGFTPILMGVMAAMYVMVAAISEVPSGILADRWSRKGVLMLAGGALALASLVSGLSTVVWVYIVGAGLWAVFDAFASGTTDSVVYDTLLEEQGNAEGYEKYYGWTEFLQSASWFAGALAGGVVASVFGLQSAYLVTVPVALASIAALAYFREPTLHQADGEDEVSVWQQVKDTLGAVLQRGTVVAVLVVLVVGSMAADIIYEFNQLWLIALAVPLIWFGPASGVLYGSHGIGSLAAQYMRLHSRVFVAVFTVVLMAAALAQVFSRSAPVVVAGQVAIALGMGGLWVLYMRKLHDRLPSRVRAGSSSAVSTIANLGFAVLALWVGWLTEVYDIFTAAWIVLAGVAVVCVFLNLTTGDHEAA
jgi:MFS family permease